MQLKKYTEIRANLTSKNGYKIYDLMIPSDSRVNSDGKFSEYIQPSGKVFYTEDKNLSKKFDEVINIEEQKTIIADNPLCFLNQTDVLTMSDSCQKAFWHLIDDKSYQETMERKYYGCAHLVREKSILIFHQLDLRSTYKYEINLNDKEEFKNVSLKLLDLYEKGNAIPEAEITNGAFDKVITNLKNYVIVPKVEKEHGLKNEIETLISFMNNFPVKFDINYDDTKKVKIIMQSGDNTKEYNVTKSSKPGYVTLGEEDVSMNNLLKDLYIESKILDKKIDSFLEKKLKI